MSVQLNFNELRDAYLGRDFIILGGGTSLHDDLAKCPDNAIRIGVNHHSPKYYQCDYIACLDVKAPDWVRAITDSPIISPLKNADYLVDKIGFNSINSGIFAIWLANQMGAARIYCCGMDFYRALVDYVDGSPPVKKQNKTYNYGHHCQRLAKKCAGDSELIRFSWW